MRITFTWETCLWPSWLWLSFLWPSWLWLSWFWVKSLSFSSLGGGDAPPFSPPPPPWHHFLGSNVDLRQKNCSCQVEVDCQEAYLCSCPIHSCTRLLNSSAWEEIWVLEIFASDCRILSWWQLFSPPSSLGHGRAPQRNAFPCSKGFQFLSLSHKWFIGEMADVYRRKLWCIQMILITRMCALNEFSWQAWLLVWETAPGFLGHK